MATTPNDDDLRTALRGSPDMTPEDTRAELLANLEKLGLRDKLRADSRATPEDTRSELLGDARRLPQEMTRAEFMRNVNVIPGDEPHTWYAELGDHYRATIDAETRDQAMQAVGILHEKEVSLNLQLVDAEVGDDVRPPSVDAVADYPDLVQEFLDSTERSGLDPALLQERQAEREARARAWTPEQAKEAVESDLDYHAQIVSDPRRQSDVFYMRSDMAENAKASAFYDQALKEAAPDLYERVQNHEEEAKDARKAAEAEAMQQEREARARAWTPEQAKAQVEEDISNYKFEIDVSKTPETDGFYARKDMAENARASAAYDQALKEAAPDLYERVQNYEREDVRVILGANSVAAERADHEADRQPIASMPGAYMAYNNQPGMAGAEVITENQSRISFGGRPALEQFAKENNLSEQDTEALRKLDAKADVFRSEPAYPEYTLTIDQTDLDRVAAARAQDTAQAREALGLDGADQAAVTQALEQQLEDERRRRIAREQEQAAQGVNSVDVQRTGKELERDEFIMPRRITQTYTEIDGKFHTNEGNRVAFEDKGNSLASSFTDKKTIEDMVALAKAKQWESVKLSGSQDFRREAWLQAESQGVRTQGYTPRESDMAALETLRQQRATNEIKPVQERRAERPAPAQEAQAPRHDLNKNQAALHAEATKNITTNAQALRKQPGMDDKSAQDLNKLAYWRGIVAEQNKFQAQPVQDEALARFDEQAADPQFLRKLDQETEAKVQGQTTERVQRRETPEHSL
jgi:hypothetical protein